MKKMENPDKNSSQKAQADTLNSLLYLIIP